MIENILLTTHELSALTADYMLNLSAELRLSKMLVETNKSTSLINVASFNLLCVNIIIIIMIIISSFNNKLSDATHIQQ